MPYDFFKKLPNIWLNKFRDRQSTLVPFWITENELNTYIRRFVDLIKS